MPSPFDTVLTQATPGTQGGPEMPRLGDAPPSADPAANGDRKARKTRKDKGQPRKPQTPPAPVAGAPAGDWTPPELAGDFKIESGIPIPRRDKWENFPLARMQPGQSFSFPAKMYNSMRAACKHIKKKEGYTDWDFRLGIDPAAPKNPDGSWADPKRMRVWRTK